MYKKYRTYARVDLSAIRHNGHIARTCFPHQKILSVLKADAYGHGISGVVPAYDSFTDWYAVATVEEALRVRALSQKEVLIFGPVPEERMAVAAQNKLTFTVGNASYAATLSECLARAGLEASCHLKIDTGLNRTGIRWRDGTALAQIKAIHSHKNLHFTGTYTHFACGEGQEDWELAFTKLQFDRFQEALDAMKQADISTGLCHCCSTGGSLMHPEYRMDMVRLGMLPMGMSYSDENVQALGLRPAMTWITHIAQIEQVLPGESVSYGCTFRTEKPVTVGIATCGYADGYRRAYSNKACVLVGGKKVPVLGRVAMDYLMIDLTDVAVQVGDPVILLGTDGINTVSAQELSQFGESVSGEVTCVISSRVPRIYTERSNEHV